MNKHIFYMTGFSIPLITLILSPVIALWENTSTDHEIFNSSGVFVDKTLFIEVFFRHCTTSKFQVITAPLGFGKTTNLKMLKRFVQVEIDELGRVKNKTQTSSYQLFTDKRLKISKHIEIVNNNLAEYPVIDFSFKDIIQSEDFAVNEINLLKKFKKLYLEYKWLYDSICENRTTLGEDLDEMQVEKNIKFMANLIETDATFSEIPSTETLYILVQILYVYFGRKVFIFIDDYDSAWVDGLRDNVDKLWFVDVGRHLHEIIYVLFRPEMRKYIAYIFMTGTNTIFLHAMSNNISYNRFLDDNHPFTRYYGFSRNELIELLERCDIDTNNIQDLRSSCNGYTTKTSKIQLFQTSSIVEYLTKSNTSLSLEDKKHPWLDSGLLIGQWKALFDGTVYQRVKHLVSNQSTAFELYRFCDENELQNFNNVLKIQQPLMNISVDWFFSLLFENGYFTYDGNKSRRFKIPNQCRAEAFNELLIKVDKILESVANAEQYYNHTESTLKVIDF